MARDCGVVMPTAGYRGREGTRLSGHEAAKPEMRVMLGG